MTQEQALGACNSLQKLQEIPRGKFASKTEYIAYLFLNFCLILCLVLGGR